MDRLGSKGPPKKAPIKNSLWRIECHVSDDVTLTLNGQGCLTFCYEFAA